MKTLAVLLALHAVPARSAPPQPPPAVESPTPGAPFRWQRAQDMFLGSATKTPTILTLMLGSNRKVWRLAALTGLDGRDGLYDPSIFEHVFTFRQTFNPFEGAPSVFVSAETDQEMFLPAPVREEPGALVFTFEGWNGRTHRYEPRYRFQCRHLDGRRLLCRWDDLLEKHTQYAGLEPDGLSRRDP